MGSIPPIHTSPSWMSSSNPPGDLANQLLNYMKELDNEIAKQPMNMNEIKDLSKKIENFLKDNEKNIYSICHQNGFPVSGPFMPQTELEGALRMCNDIITGQGDPHATVDFLNENMTQLHWEMTNVNPKN